MNQIDTHVLKFLPTHNICSLTTLLKDGSPHAAAIHFSHQDDPFELYFSTKNSTKKCEALLDGSIGKASVVFGLSDKEWITVQMDGTIHVVTDPQEIERISSVHLAKHPHAAQLINNPSNVLLKFTPIWWRYTDFNTKPITITSSES